jgi:hypothetical protein
MTAVYINFVINELLGTCFNLIISPLTLLYIDKISKQEKGEKRYYESVL